MRDKRSKSPALGCELGASSRSWSPLCLGHPIQDAQGQGLLTVHGLLGLLKPRSQKGSEEDTWAQKH